MIFKRKKKDQFQFSHSNLGKLPNHYPTAELFKKLQKKFVRLGIGLVFLVPILIIGVPGGFKYVSKKVRYFFAGEVNYEIYIFPKKTPYMQGWTSIGYLKEGRPKDSVELVLAKAKVPGKDLYDLRKFPKEWLYINGDYKYGYIFPQTIFYGKIVRD